MKKIISILLTASMLAGSAAMPFAAIAAEKATTASRASEAAKTGTLTVTVYNEDEGGLYTDEHTSFMVCGGPDQPAAPGMAGAVFLCNVTPSESNPFVMNDIYISDNFKYTIIDSGSPDYDGFNYRIDNERSDRTFKFTENPDQDLSIYMKKNYFVVNSDKSVTAATHGQDIYDNMQAVMSQTLELINSDDFKALATADRISKAKELMKSLSDEALIADYAFDAEKNVMKFTYKCGTITGQLRPAVFEDEHKQLETTDITTETIPVTTQTAVTTTTTAVNSTFKDLGVFEEGEKMTLDDVIELSKKGNALTLNDLAKFKGVIAGSGIFILEYDLGNGYTLMVGSMTLEKIDYARLKYSGSENFIDIRTDDVKEYIASTAAPVDHTALQGTKQMTLEDVMGLAKKGAELDWSDFEDYKGRDVGSGQNIWRFELEDGYTLEVCGVADRRKPDSIILSRGQDEIDLLRNDSINGFLIMTSDYTMTVTVAEINGSSLLVKNIESHGDVLTLPANKLDNGIKPVVGMKLEVTYRGGILETYPGQFGNIQKVTVLSETTEIVAGDTNCDGTMDLADAIMIMQALANPDKYGINGTAERHLTEQGKLNGDMNGDGLTVGDALAIQRKLLGLDDEEKSFSTTLLGIDKAKVIGVKVSSLPEGYDHSFTDENAQSVVDYLSNISLSTNLSVEDPGQLGGMTWVIRLVYENGDTVTLYDLGKFIHGTDRKWYEMTYEESQELSNLIWKLGQTDNDKSIDNSAIAGKIFAYEKEGAGGYCTLSFNENGRFLYSPGKLSSYMGGGDWKIDGDTVSLIGMLDKTIYLKITDDTLVYIAEGSDEFPYMDIKDGEKFGIYRPEISSDKFQLNSRYSEYGLGNPKVELDLIASELPEFCYVENVRLNDEDDNFIGMMSPAMDADIWSYFVDCHVTEECSKTYYTLTKIRCGAKTYLDDVRSEINVNFKVTPAP
ncbi:dockerin type I repeat-containing protein [Ruminococcus sp.]|uniref:dockerin type I repeat-containing protein n=1 Tax=Ruminococcus sp. TaxID=41978 RepID=UPI002C8A877C|nr:dockerin type I repeat-containing protein [Ruminococcus sp.]HOH87275.1 dockerin type I repeat-containing protein [Ruminococcus sp.]